MKTIFLGVVLFLLVLTMALPTEAARLKWDVSTGNPAGYLVEISDDGGATWAFNYTVLAPETELYLDDKLQYNKEYGLRVSAYNDAGMSAPTAPLLWTRPPYAPPDDRTLPPVAGGVLPGDVTGKAVE